MAVGHSVEVSQRKPMPVGHFFPSFIFTCPKVEVEDESSTLYSSQTTVIALALAIVNFFEKKKSLAHPFLKIN